MKCINYNLILLSLGIATESAFDGVLAKDLRERPFSDERKMYTEKTTQSLFSSCIWMLCILLLLPRGPE